MKRLLLILPVVLGLASCQSTYFFSSLKTTDPYMEKVDNGDFLLENDSLWIAYCFKGENAPIQVTVFNKMNKPLYINWERSGVVINDVAYSYAGEQSAYSEEMFDLSGDPSTSSNYDITEVFASQTRNEHFTTISPNKMVSRNVLRLNVSFDNVNKKLYKDQNMGDKNGDVEKVKSANFSVEDSPLIFTSYLTTYTNESNPLVYKQDFYISNLIKSKSIKPKDLPSSMADRGDIFYVEKPANNSFWEGLFGVTIIAGAVVLDVALSSPE